MHTPVRRCQCALLFGLFLFGPYAAANTVTPSGAHSGVLAPWDKHTFEGHPPTKPSGADDPVRLTRAALSIDVFPMFVQMDATFTLHSSAPVPVDRRVGVPVRPYGGQG